MLCALSNTHRHAHHSTSSMQKQQQQQQNCIANRQFVSISERLWTEIKYWIGQREKRKNCRIITLISIRVCVCAQCTLLHSLTARGYTTSVTTSPVRPPNDYKLALLSTSFLPPSLQPNRLFCSASSSTAFFFFCFFYLLKLYVFHLLSKQ